MCWHQERRECMGFSPECDQANKAVMLKGNHLCWGWLVSEDGLGCVWKRGGSRGPDAAERADLVAFPGSGGPVWLSPETPASRFLFF